MGSNSNSIGPRDPRLQQAIQNSWSSGAKQPNASRRKPVRTEEVDDANANTDQQSAEGTRWVMLSYLLSVFHINPSPQGTKTPRASGAITETASSGGSASSDDSANYAFKYDEQGNAYDRNGNRHKPPKKDGAELEDEQE